jgi:hypothetical protein
MYLLRFIPRPLPNHNSALHHHSLLKSPQARSTPVHPSTDYSVHPRALAPIVVAPSLAMPDSNFPEVLIDPDPALTDAQRARSRRKSPRRMYRSRTSTYRAHVERSARYRARRRDGVPQRVAATPPRASIFADEITRSVTFRYMPAHPSIPTLSACIPTSLPTPSSRTEFCVLAVSFQGLFAVESCA